CFIGHRERRHVEVQRRRAVRHDDRQQCRELELHAGSGQHMVAVPEAHDVAILPPWYAPAPRKVAIHRYLDPGFVTQFQADANNAPRDRATLFAWEREDRMTGDPGLLKLRRPVHRTFHVVAWEATCVLPTAPAVAPEKIASAGFVIRNGDAQ